MTSATRTSLVCVVAALLAGLPLTAVTQERTFLALAAVLCLISFGIGAALRHRGASGMRVRAPQLAAALILPILTPPILTPMLWQRTISLLHSSYAPVPYDPGFAVLCGSLIWIVYLLVESLTIGLTSPAWSFPALLLPYLVPCAVIFDEIQPVLLIGPAIGYALVLGATTVVGAGLRRVHAATLAVTAATTVGALVGGFVLSLPMTSISDPDQAGQTIHLSDPSLDLVRTLRRNSDQVVLRYRTSDGSGDYLRLTALPVLDRGGFHPASTPLVDLPRASAAPSAATERVDSTINVLGFTSQYLPLPWFPVSTDVPTSSWKLQQQSQTVLTKDARGTNGLTYQVTSARIPNTALDPLSLTAGQVGDAGQTLALPDELPVGVRQLARDLTRNAPTAGAKADALAAYFRSGEFTYSTAGAPGTPMGTIQDFLFGSRTGYCVQFAAAMAILARAVDIPSRVVVGFLPGRRVGDHWEVTGQNMHAWTELYFAETGWHRVDATPAGSLPDPPPSPSAVRSATPSPSSNQPTPSVSKSPDAAPDPSPTAAAAPGQLPTWPWWIMAGLGLLGAPAFIRGQLRRRRLRGSPDSAVAIEMVWAELRATTLDLGQQWPAGTPSMVASQLGAELTGTSRLALISLAQDLDQVHFDREPTRPDALRDRAMLVITGLERRWPHRLSHRLWPSSLLPRRRGSQRV